MKIPQIILFLALTLGAWAEPVAETRTAIDVAVADTDFAIPTAELGTNIPFSNFRYPFVDEDKNVLFVGNDLYRGQETNKHNGVYYSKATGKLLPLLKQEDTLPDGSKVGPLLGLRTDFRSFVIHRGPAMGSAILARSIHGKKLRVIADRSTIAPSFDKPFGAFLYADIQDQLVVFNGTIRTDPIWQHGLFLHSNKDQSLIRLIDNVQPVPQFDCVFDAISQQPEMDDKWLVFAANRLDIKSDETLPGRGIFGWRLPTKDEQGVNLHEHFSIKQLIEFAPFHMKIPDSRGRRLEYAHNPSVHEGIVAVVGGYDKPAESRYPKYQCLLVRTLDGEWRNAIDNTSLMPGREEKGKILGFTQWIGNHAKKIIFIARGSDRYRALYLYDVQQDQLSFIIDTDTPLVGKKATSFEISGHPLVGNTLAFMARFEDDTSGVYLANLPGMKVEAKRTNR